MSDAPIPQPITALQGRAPQNGLTIAIEDTGLRGMIALKGDLATPEIAQAIKTATGAPVPKPLSISIDGMQGAVWMAPDEVLLFVEYAHVEDRIASLEAALRDEHHLAANVSDARIVLKLSGTRVQEVLAKCTPVDLSDETFPVGHARRTHLGGIATAFWRLTKDEWEIVALRSVATHLYDWLAASAVSGSEVH